MVYPCLAYELIQLIIEKNNLHDLDYWIFFKWIFKTACAILILSNTFNIVMAVFDVSQSVIARAAGIVQGSTDISEAMLADLETTLETLGLGSLLGLWLQSLLIHVTMWAINIVIFVIVYGRMIEIYLLTSLAPIPVATLSNRELGSTGQNYLKSLLAVGFQGLLIAGFMGWASGRGRTPRSACWRPRDIRSGRPPTFTSLSFRPSKPTAKSRMKPVIRSLPSWAICPAWSCSQGRPLPAGMYGATRWSRRSRTLGQIVPNWR